MYVYVIKLTCLFFQSEVRHEIIILTILIKKYNSAVIY